MDAKEFLKSKGVSLHSVNATRLPHKYKNVELELIPLMEEYAELRLSNVVGQSEQLVCDCGKEKRTKYEKHIGRCDYCLKDIAN